MFSMVLVGASEDAATTFSPDLDCPGLSLPSVPVLLKGSLALAGLLQSELAFYYVAQNLERPARMRRCLVGPFLPGFNGPKI